MQSHTTDTVAQPVIEQDPESCIYTVDGFSYYEYVTSCLAFVVFQYEYNLDEETTVKLNKIFIYVAVGVGCIFLMIVFVIVVRVFSSARR